MFLNDVVVDGVTENGTLYPSAYQNQPYQTIWVMDDGTEVPVQGVPPVGHQCVYLYRNNTVIPMQYTNRTTPDGHPVPDIRPHDNLLVEKEVYDWGAGVLDHYEYLYLDVATVDENCNIGFAEGDYGIGAILGNHLIKEIWRNPAYSEVEQDGPVEEETDDTPVSPAEPVEPPTDPFHPHCSLCWGSPYIHILSAVYGSPDGAKIKDVTAKVQTFQGSDGSISFKASNANLGGDPCVGTFKRLCIQFTYRCLGVIQEIVVPENRDVIIKLPPYKRKLSNSMVF